MPGMNITSLLNPSSQISLQENSQIHNSHFEPPTSHDDFLEQMLSTLGSGPSSWAEINPSNKSPWDTSIPINGDGNKSIDLSDETVPSNHENVPFPYDESSNLASKFRDHQISNGSKSSAEVAAAAMMLQHQRMMSRGVAGEPGVFPMPFSLNNNGDYDCSQNDVVDGSSFNSLHPVSSLILFFSSNAIQNC